MVEFEQPIIPEEDLEIGSVYYGYKSYSDPNIKEWFFFVYLGEGKWGPGSVKLKSSKTFNPLGDYGQYYPVNTNRVRAVTKITVFPVGQDIWARVVAVDKNRTHHQKALIAAANCWNQNLQAAILTSPSSLRDFFLNSNNVNLSYYYNLNPLVNEGAPTSEPAVNPSIIKVAKKQYKIINCSKDRVLFKEH